MLDNIKSLLGIAQNDTDKDNLLNLIITLTTARLKVLLGNIDPPDELGYIITDVAVMRFNRIGTEGMTSHTVEGETAAFADSDFNAFAGDIQAWLDTQSESKRGKVRFL